MTVAVDSLFLSKSMLMDPEEDGASSSVVCELAGQETNAIVSISALTAAYPAKLLVLLLIVAC